MLVAEEGVFDLSLPFRWGLVAGAQVFRVACIWELPFQAWTAVPLCLWIRLQPLQASHYLC